MSAQFSLDRGAQFPFDAADAWWSDDNVDPPKATNWSHAAARGVLADLSDRRGIKQALGELDEDVRIELVKTLAEIIQLAQEKS